MSNATTIVPIGNFTPGLSRRVREMAIARAQRRAVVISMQSTERCSWSALNDLAESLRATRTPYPIRLAHTMPRTRALLRELGIHSEWFVDASALESRASVLIREDRALLVTRFGGCHHHLGRSVTSRERQRPADTVRRTLFKAS